MDNSENNKDRNFGRVAVGHLTPATSQTFKRRQEFYFQYVPHNVPRYNKISISTPSSFMFRYMHLFAIHVVSKSHNACLAKLIAMQRAGVIEESQFPLPVGWGTRLFSALPHFLAQLLFGSYWWKVSAIHEKQRPFNWANGANYKGNVVKISFLN